MGPFFDIYLRYCYGYEPGLKVLQARRQQNLPLSLPLPSPLPLYYPYPKQVQARRQQSGEVDHWFEQQRRETKVKNQVLRVG